jgi:VWFA-related protein
MRPRSKVVAILLAAGFGVPLAAQEAVFRADTRLVVLHATVVDSKGRFVTNLPRDAFHVFEDGTEQQLKIFKREDVPVSMGIVIDNSGSMRDKRKKVEDAALGLVKASNPEDEVFIVNFNDVAYLDVPMTNDMKKMEDGISRIDSRGGTAMRDAIDLSMDYLKKNAKHDKKVIVVVTDGNDNSSEITLEKLVEKMQTRDLLVYTIGLLDEEDHKEAKKAKRALDTITKATGGLSFYPNNVDDVEGFALQVARDIRNQYTLAYTPSNQTLDGGFRRVTVTAKGPNHPTVRTRTGYYATPELATAGTTAAR